VDENVGQLMTQHPVVVDASTPVSDCAKVMERREIGAVGVTSEGSLTGVLTDRDIVLRLVARGKDATTTTAGEIATPNVVTASAETTIVDAVRTMSQRAVRRLFVVDESGRPTGILTVDDLTAIRDPDSVVAAQLGEWGVWRADQGYSGDSE
jgi:CBS domain-containing protein